MLRSMAARAECSAWYAWWRGNSGDSMAGRVMHDRGYKREEG